MDQKSSSKATGSGGVQRGDPAAVAGTSAATPATRWADLVAAIVTAEADPGTIDGWASLRRMSASTLRHYCAAAGVRPKDSLAFGRPARALLLGAPCEWRPEDVLTQMDPRTLARLLTRGGVLDFLHRERPPLYVLFLAHTFPVPNAPLDALARVLRDIERG